MKLVVWVSVRNLLLYGQMSFVPGRTDLTHAGMLIKRPVNDRWQEYMI